MFNPCVVAKASLKDPVLQAKLNKLDRDAVSKIKVIAGLRSDLDNSTISVRSLQRSCPLDQTSTITTSSKPHWKETVQDRPVGGLGKLDSLPLETLHTVFAFLDLQTLTDTRCISRRAMQVVDSLPAYKEVFTYCPDVLRAMLSLQLSRHFSAHDIRSQLRRGDCWLCGDFGALLFLPSCQRCCWNCLKAHEETAPIPISNAVESFELTKDALQYLPSMLSIPGLYGNASVVGKRVMAGGTEYKRRERLVSLANAKMTALMLHGREKVSASFMESSRSQWVQAYVQQLRSGPSTLPLSQRVPKPPYPPFTRGSKFQGYEPKRYMAVIRLPFFDVVNGMTDWGLSCSGCSEIIMTDAWSQMDEAGRRYIRRMYTKLGLLQHVQECKAAQDLWERENNAAYVMREDIDTSLLDERQISWKSAQVRSARILDPRHISWRSIKLDDHILILSDVSHNEVEVLKKQTRELRRNRMSERWRKEIDELKGARSRRSK